MEIIIPLIITGSIGMYGIYKLIRIKLAFDPETSHGHKLMTTKRRKYDTTQDRDEYVHRYFKRLKRLYNTYAEEKKKPMEFTRYCDVVYNIKIGKTKPSLLDC